MGDSNTDLPKKKMTRRPTSLKWFLTRRPMGQRFRMEFDSDGEPIGPYGDKFRSYLGVVARTKVSILPMAWDEVDEQTKKIVWDSVLVCIYTNERNLGFIHLSLFLVLTPPYSCVKETFDVPDDEEFKKTWMVYIGLCWKQFKTTLTTKYVFGKGDKSGETTPFHKYPSISTETWTAFVKSRLTSEFVVLFSPQLFLFLKYYSFIIYDGVCFVTGEKRICSEKSK